MVMGSGRALRVAALSVVVGACSSASGGEHGGDAQVGVEGVPIYANLGSHSRAITTGPRAQEYFDQGLRLQYAFNHAEAVRSYEAALALDPTCAMCWWGIALASGPNINAPMEPEAGATAFAAIGRARERVTGTSEVEKALISALSARYGRDPGADRAALDSAYAEAMAGVASLFPEDDDVQTLFGAALMNLRPWDYWSGEYGARMPNPGTEEILDALETALDIDPENPGACHYFIHAVEAAHPERAEACADRLIELMPGAGHIVHMPGHVYIRVGRYADAVDVNEHAVHSDETFIADQSPMGLYPSAYYPHNYHFMAFAATMAGMSRKAMEASRIVAPKIPKDVALSVYWIQNAVVFPHLTAVSFGRWDEVLSLPMPDPELTQATVMALYARGIAHAALGDAGAAQELLQELVSVAEAADPDGANPVLAIARHALTGDIALRAGNPHDAAGHFRAAVDIEQGMLYEEPPLWYYPVRQSLGKALLEAGRPAEAEAEYRTDLLKFPRNGWSLYGLAKSMEAQGRDASSVWSEFGEAWKDADVALVASRF